MAPLPVSWICESWRGQLDGRVVGILAIVLGIIFIAIAILPAMFGFRAHLIRSDIIIGGVLVVVGLLLLKQTGRDKL